MKNATTGRLGGFLKGLFKSSSWKAVVQDLPLSNKGGHAALVSTSTPCAVMPVSPSLSC